MHDLLGIPYSIFPSLSKYKSLNKNTKQPHGLFIVSKVTGSEFRARQGDRWATPLSSPPRGIVTVIWAYYAQTKSSEEAARTGGGCLYTSQAEMATLQEVVWSLPTRAYKKLQGVTLMVEAHRGVTGH